jgi:L-arabinokinase
LRVQRFQTIAFYVSGHGFGHASRDVEVMRALRERLPDIRIAIRTAAAPELFDALGRDVVIDRVAVDTGMTQIDSLRIDEDESARQAAAFYARFERRAAEEAAALGRLRADAVVGDVPPLAFAAAAATRIPSIAVANFTWDWIYAAHESFVRLAPGVIDVIRRAYSHTSLALRLPMHGGFETMPHVRGIPLIARTSSRDRDETRRLLGLRTDRPAVLPSFGGYGVDLPWGTLRRAARFALMEVDAGTMKRHGLQYQDLVAAADVVVSKPGYGIVTECIANGTALLYALRGRFAEQDVFLREMPALMRCREIGRDDLQSGQWEGAIDALLAQPAPAARPRVDGALVAAEAIEKFLT